jgi:hypothetical protein
MDDNIFDIVSRWLFVVFPLFSPCFSMLSCALKSIVTRRGIRSHIRSIGYDIGLKAGARRLHGITALSIWVLGHTY